MPDDNPRLPERIKGGFLARAAAADYRSFYVSGAALKVPISVENVNIAAMRTNKDGSRIAISHDMAAEEIDSPERLFFHLLIVSHEIGHLVHRHEYRGPMDREDEINVEFWADFYSGKVMIALVTYGQRLRPILQRFYPPGELPFEEVLKSIGVAVTRLVETVYSDDPRYPPKLVRASLINNGITSVLRHELVNPHPIWYFSVIKRVLLASPTINALASANPDQIRVNRDQIERIRTWHRERQGGDVALTPGLKFQFHYLHTTFDHTEEEITAAEVERRSELTAYYGEDIFDPPN